MSLFSIEQQPCVRGGIGLGSPESRLNEMPPFLHLRRKGREVLVTGKPSCALGRPLSGPGRDPDGVFVEWSWDGRRLTVRRDRYGLFPLYYFVRPGEICISTSILELLKEGAPTEFNEAGLAVFLRLGFFIGEDTPFRDIHAFPACAVVEWEGGGLRASGGVRRSKVQPISRDEAIDAYIRLFRRSIQRRLPSGDFVVPLSGGADSRHILFELCSAGCRPRYCITLDHVPPHTNEDIAIAAQVAEAVGVTHIVLPYARSRLNAELRKNLATSFCADEHAWYLPMADFLAGKGLTVYDGIGGDVLSAGLSLDEEGLELFEGTLEQLCDHLFKIHAAPRERDLAALLTSEFYRRVSRDAAVARLAREVTKHADAHSPATSFHFWNRTRREMALAPFNLLLPAGQVLCPYLDHDLYDFLTSIPAVGLLDLQLHTETIRRAYPQYAHIPFGGWSGPRVEDRMHVRRFARELVWYVLTHLPSDLVGLRDLLPRLIRRCVDGIDPIGARYSLAPYLLQLERLKPG